MARSFSHTVCIGDIHGHYERLLRLWKVIEHKLGESEFETCTVIFLGDYNDRGPDSKLVYDWLVNLPNLYPNQKHIFLMGNHDFAFAAFIGSLPPAPPGFQFKETWQKLIRQEYDEGWWNGENVEDMHVQGRRWGGTVRKNLNHSKKEVYKGSTFDSATTFESYGVEHGDRDGLVKAVPESHKNFLRNLSWIYEQEGKINGDYDRLIAVHAGFDFNLPLANQIQELKTRNVTIPRLESMSGRKNVVPIHPELEKENVLVVSGHHGFILIETKRIIMDESGGREIMPLSAIILPSTIVRHNEEMA